MSTAMAQVLKDHVYLLYVYCICEDTTDSLILLLNPKL